MDTAARTNVTVQTTINAPVEKVWETWNEPAHITQWYQASSDWHAPYAENDLRAGGKLKITMAAKDSSVSFDFEGVYDKVIPHKTVAYTLPDGRKVVIDFSQEGSKTRVTETFDTETSNPVDLQRSGWQSILDSFKQYTEKQ